MELHVDDLIDLMNRRLTYLDRWSGVSRRRDVAVSLEISLRSAAGAC
jgi:hypothetical protein